MVAKESPNVHYRGPKKGRDSGGVPDGGRTHDSGLLFGKDL